jgi:hypothetical protein
MGRISHYVRVIGESLADIPDCIICFDDELPLIFEMLLIEGIFVDLMCWLLP